MFAWLCTTGSATLALQWVRMCHCKKPIHSTSSASAAARSFNSMQRRCCSVTVSPSKPSGSCVWPRASNWLTTSPPGKTLPGQLKAANLSWKGYMEDLGKSPALARATCGNPTLNARDRTQSSRRPSAELPDGDMYAARHNPFVFFHSIVDSADCDTNVVNLNRLENDLKAVETTANFTWITPGMCHGGHDTPCVNGQPGGLESADMFLQKWVPMVIASPAFKRDGLLIITFDQGAPTDSYSPDGKTRTYVFAGDSCCNQLPTPNVKFPITQPFPKELTRLPYDIETVIERQGGGRIGAVMLSPFIKPGTVSDKPYNHYALLRTLQDLFGLKNYLGYAGQEGLKPIGDDVFNNR